VKHLKRVLGIAGFLLALAYAADSLSVRIPIPPSRQVYGAVTVRPYYDVPQKSGKSVFYFLDPQKRTCVNSLFPQMGYSPCWFLRRHARQRIPM